MFSSVNLPSLSDGASVDVVVGRESWLVSGGLLAGLLVGFDGGGCLMAWPVKFRFCVGGSSSLWFFRGVLGSAGLAGAEARYGEVRCWGYLGGGGGLFSCKSASSVEIWLVLAVVGLVLIGTMTRCSGGRR